MLTGGRFFVDTVYILLAEPGIRLDLCNSV